MSSNPDETPERTIGADTKTPGEAFRDDESDRISERKKVVSKESLEAAFRAATTGEYRTAGIVLARRLLPALGVDEINIEVIDEHLEGSVLAWNYHAVRKFLREAPSLIAAAPEGGDTLTSNLNSGTYAATGRKSPARTAQQTITDVLRAAESIAVLRGYVEPELTRTSIISGYSGPLGIMWQPYDWEIPDPLPIVNPDTRPAFSISLGLPGAGKSTGLLKEAIDRYYAGHKVLDLHDSKKLENGSYDVEQMQQELREIREKMGQPAGFGDKEKPDVEIMVPLTPELENTDVLYDTENSEFRVTPFVIPASGPEESVVKAMLDPGTPAAWSVINTALGRVTGDWTLKDLANEVQQVNETQDVIDRAFSAVEKLQERGFVRDSQSKYVIDWEQKFEETDTITVFSTSLMDRESEKLMILYYLVHSVFKKRMGRQNQPRRAAIVLRELHHICPTQKNRKEDWHEKNLQEKIAGEMRNIAAERRHANLEVLADSQQWGQIAKRIREQIDRVLMFQTHASPAQTVFSDLIGTRNMPYSNRIFGFSSGFCSVISPERIGGEDYNMAFAQPVQMLPPECHQIDTDEEGSGWQVRVEHTDDEYAQPPSSWGFDVPQRLRFGSMQQPGSATSSSGSASAGTNNSGQQGSTQGGVPSSMTSEAFKAMLAFLDEGTVTDPDDTDCRVSRALFRESYKGFVMAEWDDPDEQDKRLFDKDEEFGEWLRAACGTDITDGKTTKGMRTKSGTRENAYIGIKLSINGKDWLSMYQNGTY